jgi:hypothetical protein
MVSVTHEGLDQLRIKSDGETTRQESGLKRAQVEQDAITFDIAGTAE